MVVSLLKTFLLPPALQLVMVLIATILWSRYRFVSRFLMFLAWSSLLLLSLPIVSSSIFTWLESPYRQHAAIARELHNFKDSNLPQAESALAGADAFLSGAEGSLPDAEDFLFGAEGSLSNAEGSISRAYGSSGGSTPKAVVVLGGGRVNNAPEYNGRDQVSHHSLWRLRHGARVAKAFQVPVIVSGGTVYSYEKDSEAFLAAEVLRTDFGISDIWQEDQSRDTWQNAHKTALLLKSKNIETIFLVTHAYHMRRSEFAFQQAGVNVIPMPTGFFGYSNTSRWDVWLPEARALAGSRIALHEYLGLGFYYVRSML